MNVYGEATDCSFHVQIYSTVIFLIVQTYTINASKPGHGSVQLKHFPKFSKY